MFSSKRTTFAILILACATILLAIGAISATTLNVNIQKAQGL